MNMPLVIMSYRRLLELPNAFIATNPYQHENRLYIFPSWLPHGVEENKTD